MPVRWWILAGLAAVCIVAGMMIYVPSLEYKETLSVETGPTAPPMQDITMADRDINLNFVSPLGEPDEAATEDEADPSELVLTFDARLEGGVADLYPSEGGIPVLIDIASGKWNEALTVGAIERPDLGLDAGEAAQTLRLESGILALGGEAPSTLYLYDGEGERVMDLTVPALSPDLDLMPMANPDCAYVAKVGSSTVFDTQTGNVAAVSAPGRPVWLDRGGNTLTLERGGDYVVRGLTGGDETVYRLVY